MGNSNTRLVTSTTDQQHRNGQRRSSLKDFLAEDEGEIQPDSPSIRIIGTTFSSINLEEAEMDVDVEINNSGGSSLNLISIDILLQSESRCIMAAKHDYTLSILPEYTECFKINLTIVYNKIHDLYPEIKPGQIIPYVLRLSPSFQEKLNIGIISAEKAGKLPIPLEPIIRLNKGRLYEISMEQITLKLQLKLENQNPFHISVVKMEYNVFLAGEMVVSGSVNPKTVVRSNTSKLLDFPVSFWPKNLAAALFTMARGRGAGLTIDWKIHAYTYFGPMQL